MMDEKFQNMQLKLSNFNLTMRYSLGRDFEESVRGIQTRIFEFGALFQTLQQILQSQHDDLSQGSHTQEAVICIANVENMLSVVYTVLLEIKELPLLEFKFVERLLKISQERIEYLYNTLMLLQSNLRQLRKQTEIAERARKLISSSITPKLGEIQQRAQLTLPILVYMTQTIQQYCEPVDAILHELDQLQQLVSQAEPSHSFKETAKRKPIVDEIQHMVAYVKRLEFQLKLMMQTPNQLFKLLTQQNQASQQQREQKKVNFNHQLLNEDVKAEDVKRIEKVTATWYQYQRNFETFIQQVSLQEFFSVLQLLEQQQALTKLHQQQFPLVREGIEQRVSLVVADFKEYVDKAKKIYAKLNQIQEFQPPATSKEDEDVIPPEEFQSLICYLKQQHEYLFEREQLKIKMDAVVQRSEQFYNIQYQRTVYESLITSSKNRQQSYDWSYQNHEMWENYSKQ